METAERFEIDDAKYVALTTYAEDGTARTTPVWVAGSAGRYFVITSAASHKVKRLRRDPRVEVAVCDARGRVEEGAPIYRGTARLLEGPERHPAVEAVRRKYGLMAKLLPVMARLRRQSPDTVGIEVDLDGTIRAAGRIRGGRPSQRADGEAIWEGA
jgi:PPOX class probable F420-dependent enzyme